jgi:endonuclease/exonuclease/phosphatase family metal-dependent hydrolase
MCKWRRFSSIIIVLWTVAPQTGRAADDQGTIRVATYNTSLYRDRDDQLIHDLETGDNEQARKIAEVIQRVRPDVLLLNEFDYDAQGRAAELFRTMYLAIGQNGCEPITYEFSYSGSVNTGVPSGRDFGHNGKTTDPDDAFGFGRHPGQYGMLVLSKFPIQRDRVRSFQKFLWRDMPNAMLPIDPMTGKPYYNDDDLAVLRLSSKSFWDVPIDVPARNGNPAFTLHLLGSHPTPPVFDGPEDRNGRRNHDEVRLLADYSDGKKGDYLKDDAGKAGGLTADAQFVIVGDLNSDPIDGQSVPGTMKQLLNHPRVNASFTPTSEGGKLATERKLDPQTAGRGDPAHDTSDFGEFQNLRIDYALPSNGLEVIKGGIFWPKPGQPGADAVTATDHRSVWIDVRPKR